MVDADASTAARRPATRAGARRGSALLQDAADLGDTALDLAPQVFGTRTGPADGARQRRDDPRIVHPEIAANIGDRRALGADPRDEQQRTRQASRDIDGLTPQGRPDDRTDQAELALSVFRVCGGNLVG